MRKCIGCQQSKPQKELMRFTVSGSTVLPDPDGLSPGRGIYLCSNEDCIRQSFKRKAWNRILKSRVNNEEIQRAIDTALTYITHNNN